MKIEPCYHPDVVTDYIDYVEKQYVSHWDLAERGDRSPNINDYPVASLLAHILFLEKELDESRQPPK